MVQLLSGEDKEENVNHAIEKIREAHKTFKPRVIALPECFNAPYSEELFDDYAEVIPSGFTSQKLSAIAKELGIYLLGGSIPERDDKDASILYNTATVWSPTGELIAKHRKVHLFDVELKGVYKFTESEALTPGKQFTTFMIDGIKCGLAICYDINFVEFMKLYRMEGVELMFIPAAFNILFGQTHWELLGRSRAMDNQFFLAIISPARNEGSVYEAWGYSMLIDPIGKIIKQAKEYEEIIHSTIGEFLLRTNTMTTESNNSLVCF